MGLFSQLPEEPSEWAGLPSEPQRPESEAERPADAAPAAAGISGLFGSTDGSFASISVPVEVDQPAAEDAASADPSA